MGERVSDPPIGERMLSKKIHSLRSLMVEGIREFLLKRPLLEAVPHPQTLNSASHLQSVKKWRWRNQNILSSDAQQEYGCCEMHHRYQPIREAESRVY